MISKIVDATEVFNADSAYVQDLSGWDYAVVQIVSPSSAVSFKTTNDSGYDTGVLPPSPVVPENWLAVQGVDLATGTAATSTNASSTYKFNVIGKYLQLIGTTVTATKVIISLNKINP